MGPFFEMGVQIPEKVANALTEYLSDSERRLNSLYHILDKEGKCVRFKMNWAQERLHRDPAMRKNVLKVRQLGISTYTALRMLDGCLFNPNFNAAIVDKKLDDGVEKISKMWFAYEHLDYLPENPSPWEEEMAEIGRMIKEHFTELNGGKPLVKLNGIFRLPNGSQAIASTSKRGGTLQLLHVSELGYIAAHDPIRAKEVISGSMNSAGKGSEVIFESTHEGGKSGVNYEQIMAAMANNGKELTPLGFRFFFFPWYEHPEYQLEGYELEETSEDTKYFAALERDRGITLTTAQRAWYMSMKATQGSLIRQEYPSTPEEALSPVNDGAIYFGEIMGLREAGRWETEFEVDPHRPIYTAWDIGHSDYMVIWWIQPDGRGKWLVLDCYTANRQNVGHYLNVLKERDVRYGRCTRCVLPHDSVNKDYNGSDFSDYLRQAGYESVRVPRTQNRWLSIDHTRQLLRTCVIHRRCGEATVVGPARFPSGCDALSNYSMPPPGAMGREANEPLHNEYSHACDALRCFADAVHLGYIATELGWQYQPKNKRRRDSADDYLDY